MHRFYLPPAACSGSTLSLDGREAHHALHVLRIRQGERVLVLDGAGREFTCELVEANRDSVGLAVRESRTVQALPWSLGLVQAIPKGKIIEAIIQKATELGVARIFPLLSERVVAQFDSESAAHKAEKWQQVAIEAIKQSGNAWLPVVHEPMTPETLLARANQHDLFLIGSLRQDSRHPRERLEAFTKKNGRPPQSISVWIGPEGDFTDAEYDCAQAAGALPISLGRQILRSETAATYCLSVLSYELQWLHGASDEVLRP